MADCLEQGFWLGRDGATGKCSSASYSLRYVSSSRDGCSRPHHEHIDVTPSNRFSGASLFRAARPLRDCRWTSIGAPCMPVPLTFFRRADPYLAATVGYLRGAILSVLA